MTISTYKIIELVATSKISWEDAAKNAVATASKSLRDLRIAEVKQFDMKIENGKVDAVRVALDAGGVAGACPGGVGSHRGYRCCRQRESVRPD